MIRFIKFCCFLLLLYCVSSTYGAEYTYEIDCNNLRMGQYICPHPDYEFIDPKTQQPKGCTKENKAKGISISIKIIIKVMFLFNSFT